VNGRTQYLGHLFVQRILLSESPMRNHPLNPMTDSNLVRFLQKQTAVRVGLIDLATLRRGDMRAAADRLRAEGVRIALVDAIEESDLALIADVCHNIPLITGGSGLARHLPRYWTLQSRNPVPLTVRERRTVILAGVARPQLSTSWNGTPGRSSASIAQVRSMTPGTRSPPVRRL